jgi:hypothetical protein
MPWSRLFNFQPGTKISSSQVNVELDQFIEAANTLEGEVEAVQVKKITSDSGAFKLSVNLDILQEVFDLGVGFHTFYAPSASQNAPVVGKPVRGIAHVTSAGFGYIWAIDSDNRLYSLYVNNGVSSAWRSYVAAEDAQTVLWSGTSYPLAANTISPSKALSECRNGWLLVWSDYDFGVGSNDFDIAFSFVPKGDPFAHGNSHIFDVPNTLTSTSSGAIRKKLLISDDSIVGSDDNNVSSTNTNDAVLRYVLEF